MATTTATSVPRLIGADGLGALFDALVADGYRVIGPAVQDGAIVLRELSSAAELPSGWGVELEPGGYRLRRRDDAAAFGHAAGPQSLKRFLRGGSGFDLALLELLTALLAGCGAICPAFSRGCYGCFGPVATPNVPALATQLRRLGMTEAGLDRVLATFNAASPALASARQAMTGT